MLVDIGTLTITLCFASQILNVQCVFHLAGSPDLTQIPTVSVNVASPNPSHVHMMTHFQVYNLIFFFGTKP